MRSVCFSAETDPKPRRVLQLLSPVRRRRFVLSVLSEKLRGREKAGRSDEAKLISSKLLGRALVTCHDGEVDLRTVGRKLSASV